MDAASVLVVLASLPCCLGGPPRNAPLRSPAPDALIVVITSAPGTAPSAPARANAILVVPCLDATGTSLDQYLPSPAPLLSGHLHRRVVMAPSLIVKGRVELDVHVAAGLLRVPEGIGRAVHRVLPLLDLALAAEGRHSAGAVVLLDALGAVLRVGRRKQQKMRQTAQPRESRLRIRQHSQP